MANYAAVLVLGHLSWAAAAGVACVVARLGLETVLRGQSATSVPPRAADLGVGAAEGGSRFLGAAGRVFLALLLAILAVWTVSTPVAEWDPKSIWFFHAKIIYFAGGLFGDSGWNDPDLRFAHPDYPKMLTILAAQAASLFGHWNDYVTKLALVIAQLAVVLGLAAAAQTRFVAALLVCAILIFHAPAYTTGYMDIYLAAFAAIAMLMLGRAVLGGEGRYLLPGVLACALLPCVKNEGYLAALIILSVMAGAMLLRRDRAPLLPLLERALPLLAAGFLPAVLWAATRRAWEVRSWPSFGADYWELFSMNLSGPALLAIADELGRHGKVLSGAFILAIACAWLRRVPPISLACAAVAIVYTMLLGLVYLGASNDIAGHLETSASRTALTIHTVLYCGVACALGELARRHCRRD
jgi:hypothetical protein